MIAPVRTKTGKTYRSLTCRSCPSRFQLSPGTLEFRGLWLATPLSGETHALRDIWLSTSGKQSRASYRSMN